MDEKMMTMMTMMTVRAATAPANINRFHIPKTNYFCGSGQMSCPVCNTGTLRYSRDLSNGHVHARCSTEGCVAWME
jgi:hypothetical protein